MLPKQSSPAAKWPPCHRSATTNAPTGYHNHGKRDSLYCSRGQPLYGYETPHFNQTKNPVANWSGLYQATCLAQFLSLFPLQHLHKGFLSKERGGVRFSLIYILLFIIISGVNPTTSDLRVLNLLK